MVGLKTYQEALDEMAVNANYANPYREMVDDYTRRDKHAALFAEIQAQIEKLFYPQFISYPRDAEFIEALIRLTNAVHILEVGMYTGFTTLHMIRAVYPHGFVVAVDNQKVYPAIFERPEIQQCFRFYQGDTPDILRQPYGIGGMVTLFDLVYIDSDHSVEHTEKELEALWPVTRPGSTFVFHDTPFGSDMERYLLGRKEFRGLVLPGSKRLDVTESPNLGVFIRL